MDRGYLSFRAGQAETEDSAAAQRLQDRVDQDIICCPLFAHAKHSFRTLLMYPFQITDNIPKLKTLSKDSMMFGVSRAEEFDFPSFTITHLCCYRASLLLTFRQVFHM